MALINSFLGTANLLRRFFPNLKLKLIQAGIEKDEVEYIAEALMIASFFFAFSLLALFFVLLIFENNGYSWALLTAFLLSIVVFFQKMFSPNLKAVFRVRNLDRNLSAALQSIHVQINSGITLFEVLVNISRADYGEISKELKKTVKEINSGKPEIKALEDLAERNPSKFFRRAIWQIINGMRGGADISAVIEETNRALTEEQIIQIQNYGSRLTPLAMFYMLIAVILPALSVTFLVIFLSFVNISAEAARGVFYGAYFVFLFLQIMFIGMVSSRRPSLL